MKKGKQWLSVTAIGLFLAGTVQAEKVHQVERQHGHHQVNQTQDINAKNHREVYQFMPDFLYIQPGEQVEFLGTYGKHTAHTIQGMLPDGAKKVKVRPGGETTVTFTEPGVYGIKCKFHGRNGMLMAIVVGSSTPNIAEAKSNLKRQLRGYPREKMAKLLEKASAFDL